MTKNPAVPAPILTPRNPVLREAVEAATAHLRTTVVGTTPAHEQYMARITHEALYSLLTARGNLDASTIEAALSIAREADSAGAAAARKRVAAHEASHAVIGLAMGLTVRTMSLLVRGAELGRVQFYPRHNPTPEESWAFAVTALAGAHGEQHLLGLSAKPVMGDSEAVLSNILHLANIGWSPEGTPTGFAELLAAAIAHAKQQVADHAADILVLAAALEKEPTRELSGLDVVTLLTRFTGKTYPLLKENKPAPARR